MREKGQTEVAKTLETPVFSRGIEILTEKIQFVCTVPANRGAVSYVEQNQLLAQTGLQITHVRPGETVTGVVKINNDTTSTESGILLLALYDRNGTLVDVKYEPYSVSANTAGFEKTLAIAIPDAPGYTVKRMVWTGFDSLMPIVSAISAD